VASPLADLAEPTWQRREAAWHRFGIEARQVPLVIDFRPKGVTVAEENVVVIRFPRPGTAHEALTVLKDNADDDRLGLKSAAVVERTASGDLRTIEDWDNLGPVGMAGGGLIGMLVGVLGGPVGVLIGWGAGATLGGAYDLEHAETSDEALTVLGTAIPAGSTAVIADVEEFAVEVIDVEMKKLDAEVIVTRRPIGEVMAELEAVEDAADAAAREARRTVREKRKAELHASVDERVGKLKEKLHA
jgi:uncharacterized membrane protein